MKQVLVVGLIILLGLSCGIHSAKSKKLSMISHNFSGEFPDERVCLCDENLRKEVSLNVNLVHENSEMEGLDIVVYVDGLVYNGVYSSDFIINLCYCEKQRYVRPKTMEVWGLDMERNIIHIWASKDSFEFKNKIRVQLKSDGELSID